MVKRRRAKDPTSYTRREYRRLADGKDLVASYVTIKDTDLQIFTDRDVTGVAEEYALQYRTQIERYGEKVPGFFTALAPLPADGLAPPIVRDMLQSGERAGVGPMAAVAGAIAEYVGRSLIKEGCREVVVENGGDIYINRSTAVVAAIFAGTSPLSMQVGIRLQPGQMPLGLCTSSATVGHSLSFGAADSVTVFAASTAFADAVATRLGNEVGSSRQRDGIARALAVGKAISGIRGIVIVKGEKIGAVGDVELVKLT